MTIIYLHSFYNELLWDDKNKMGYHSQVGERDGFGFEEVRMYMSL